MAPFRRLGKKLFLIVFLPILLLFQIQPAQAAILDDLFKHIQNAVNSLSPKSSNNVTINSTITLAPGGDVNNNGKIDAGDIITLVAQ